MADEREALGRAAYEARIEALVTRYPALEFKPWSKLAPHLQERDMQVGEAVAARIREGITPDPETPLSDALHTLGEVRRMAESMAMSAAWHERQCGRRILAALGEAGGEGLVP